MAQSIRRRWRWAAIPFGAVYLIPLVLALGTCYALARAPDSTRTVIVARLMLVVVALAWAGTAIAMSALDVAPEPGVHTMALASAGKIASNFRLWWHSVAVLGNGDFFGRQLTFTSGLAVVCAVLSIVAVVLLPRVGLVELRARWRRRTAEWIEPAGWPAAEPL